ncbi:cytochrome C [Geothermobacter hydrogeniphilus]|uniref:Cytochrome C n=1 Tax=Geothermobacter hydrogeniphilus TaxID=1969733 RepID=A0A2K2HDZ3_9BACT|nr:cytochrome C [Geothermobacter hydrogeniphilus]PNU21507.1 cytochrome C [Geothermobacter hydrogeniphilus]
MKAQIILILLTAGLIIPCLSATPARAIPAFARQYKTECKTCHTVFPERNEFGDAFEKNGFIWPGKVHSQPQVKTTLSPAERQKAEAMYNSGLPEQLPVSLLAQHDVTYNSDAQPNFDLDAETELEIFAAGNFRNQVGFWAEYNFEPDKTTGEIYLQLQQPYNLPFNVKLGEFKPKLSIWKANDRPSLSKFGYNGMKVGNNDFEIAGEQGAVELNGVLGSRLFVAAGVTNGPDPKSANNGKDYYGHISVRIGGTDFLGKEPEVDLDHDSVWDYLTLTIGSFGYFGSNADGVNDFYRAGLESETLYKRLRVRVSGIYGRDDDPSGTGVSVDSRFALAQVEYLIGSGLMPSMRFEFQDIDEEGITRRYIPGISYALLQNVRFAVEYLHETTPDETIRETTGRVTFVF